MAIQRCNERAEIPTFSLALGVVSSGPLGVGIILTRSAIPVVKMQVLPLERLGELEDALMLSLVIGRPSNPIVRIAEIDTASCSADHPSLKCWPALFKP